MGEKTDGSSSALCGWMGGEGGHRVAPPPALMKEGSGRLSLILSQGWSSGRRRETGGGATTYDPARGWGFKK